MSSRQKLTVGLVLDTTTKDEGECGRMKDQTDRQTDRIENVCVFMIRKGMVRSTQIRLKARSRKANQEEESTHCCPGLAAS